MPRSSLRPLPSRPGGEAGYNMVLLVVIMTVMNIGLAAMLPSFTATIQRDKEEELVFRGLQYAEAIRVFQNRFQRLPVKLDELIQAQPRSIRQLWKDPMTEDGKWSLIFQGQDQVPPPVTPQVPGRDPRGANGGQEAPDDGSQLNKPPKAGDEVAVGPIVGVRSRSEKASFLVWNGRQRYDEWRFTVDLITGAAAPRGAQAGAGAFVPNPAANAQGIVTPGAMPQMSSRWIGRPWDQSLVPPGMGTPGQQPTGLQPPSSNTLGGKPKPPQTNPVN
jgi:type II secretory pathway pseudopilin PulG